MFRVTVTKWTSASEIILVVTRSTTRTMIFGWKHKCWG